jgi:hypothetical protein
MGNLAQPLLEKPLPVDRPILDEPVVDGIDRPFDDLAGKRSFEPSSDAFWIATATGSTLIAHGWLPDLESTAMPAATSE